ncbi:hypothetical protein DUI87_05285 [Hirundo rustica rustica]|uniref:Cleavage and polyadenylation specificity factor subunit 4 n=1 Tax=Hirundo rustica rustica TaxID=333673 RepID=A0A3M0KY42_HIRRU|nr:hypothetical protein DUI87_05285 [Hirundo rustica rustica]
MQELIASVDHITFDLELAVEQQLGAQPLPFPGMDRGMCPFRHISGEKTVVCKHWLRGLCKKGDQCEFLHEYDMTKMPECYFYSKFGECSNKECPFLHIDPESKIKDCPWYDRGFCKHDQESLHGYGAYHME